MGKVFFCLLIVGGAAAGCWLYIEGKPPFGPPQKEEQNKEKEKNKIVNKKQPTKSDPAPKKNIAKTENAIAKKSEIPDRRTDASKTPRKKPEAEVPKIDLSATSFEDPFYNGYWDANDWSFGGKFMSCDTSSTSSATFLRDLKAPSLDFVLTPGTISGFLEIRLKSKSNGTLTMLYFSSGAVRVSARRGKRSVVLGQRRKTLYDRAGQKCEVKITATGKNIIVYWNGKRLLRCEQPPEQRGQPLTISFIATRARYNISKMRIEGRD